MNSLLTATAVIRVTFIFLRFLSSSSFFCCCFSARLFRTIWFCWNSFWMRARISGITFLKKSHKSILRLFNSSQVRVTASGLESVFSVHYRVRVQLTFSKYLLSIIFPCLLLLTCYSNKIKDSFCAYFSSISRGNDYTPIPFYPLALLIQVITILGYSYLTLDLCKTRPNSEIATCMLLYSVTNTTLLRLLLECQ